MIITLPWPDRHLSPNARLTWRSKMIYTAMARDIGFSAARQVFTPGESAPLTGELRVTYHIYPPNKHSRDEDNLLSNLKGVLDGVAKGLEIDDKEFHGAVCVWHEPEPPGRIEMEINESPAAER